MFRMRLVRIWSLVSGISIYLQLTADKENKGYTTPLNYLSKSQSVELYGRFHADLFNSDRMLINGVDMNIRLTSAPEAFCLLRPEGGPKICIKILDATLFITQI